MLLAILLLLPLGPDLPVFPAAAPLGATQDKQDKIELKEFKSSYLLSRPAAYSDRASWPLILDLGGPKDSVREPDCFVARPADPENEALALACLADVKTRYRIHPERVVVVGGAEALNLASSRDELFAGCVLRRARALRPPAKCPPCVLFVGKEDPDTLRSTAVAMVLKKHGIDVEVREVSERPGAILQAIDPKIHPRGDLPKADAFQRAGRFLDASLICFDLLEDPKVEFLARAKLRSIEGAAIMELAKVEIAMADKKYKDAILRCREAARQFAWVPTGERIRKRLSELELRPEVKRALESED
jgi:hypothetical protein